MLNCIISLVGWLVVRMANSATYEFFKFIVYNEDIARHELVDCCVKSTLPCYISPLHDSDRFTRDDLVEWIKDNNKQLLKSLGLKNGACLERLLSFQDVEGFQMPSWSVGDLKKPHWHVLVQMPRRYSPTNALYLLNQYMPFLDIRVCYGADYSYSCKYWSHLNAPSKAQYNPKDAIALNGLVPDLSVPQGVRPHDYALLELMSYINAEPNMSLNKVLYHFKSTPDILQYIEKHTYLVCRLIDERRL